MCSLYRFIPPQLHKTQGLIDPPRGLAVAVIEIGKHQIAVYSVHLKSNLVRDGSERTKQVNILKRELSADQLVNHAALLKRDYPSLDGVVIAGDFNTNADQDLFISERTLGVFEQRGFTNTWAGIPLIERITHPGKGQYPNATFDYVFAKGIRSVGSPQIVSAPFSDHRAVTAICRCKSFSVNCSAFAEPDSPAGAAKRRRA